LEDIGVQLNSPIKEGPPDLFPGLLPLHGELIVAGETNVGKSLLSLEIISSATTGKPLWGELQPTKQIKKVLYVLAEHYIEVIQRLLVKTKLEMPDSVYILGPEHLKYDKWIVSRGQPNTVALNKFMKWAEGCDLIVWDPFSAFVCGEGVEQDNITMRMTLDNMSLVAQTAGAACLVLAHQGKPTMNPYGQEVKRKSYAIRGASAIEDAATNIFYMDHASAGHEAIEKSSGGKVYELILRKYKGDAPEKYTLLRNMDTLTHHLITGSAFEAQMKWELRNKVQRVQEGNPKWDHFTCIKQVAIQEGKSVETVQRWLGELIDKP
jgi:RecA-family ATPase